MSVVVAAYGCALDWTVPAAGSTTPGDAGAARDGDAAPTVPPVTNDGGDPTGVDGGITPGGCRSNDDCAPTDLCIFPGFDCGGSGQPGACVSRKASDACSSTPNSPARYCGCDGKLYDSPCLPLAAGVDLGTRCQVQQPVDNFASVGFVSCTSDAGIAVEDRSREHTSVDRCEVSVDTTCANDCNCLLKTLCSSTAPSNGSCNGRVVHCP